MQNKRNNFQDIILIFIDVCSLIFSYILASILILRFFGNPQQRTLHDITHSLWLIFVTYFCVFLLFNMHRDLLKHDAVEEFIYIVKANIIAAILFAFVVFLFKQSLFLRRSTWLLTVCFNIGFMFLGHTLIKTLLNSRYLSGPKPHMYIVTTTERAEHIVRRLRENENSKNYVISLALIDKKMRNQTCFGFPVVADCDNLYDFAKTEVVDEVYLNIPCYTPDILQNYITNFEQMGIIVHISLDILKDRDGFIPYITNLAEHPVIRFAPRFYDYNKLFIKRILDIAGGCVGVLLTLILTIFLAPAILLESPGPLFFKQKRVGTNGRFFYIYKFRSMYQDAEERKAALMAQNEMKGQMFKLTNDPRITKVGRFIRATSLDEFPQFWNVLKGDMSLVGTRPPTIDEFHAYEAHHKRRLSMKPGLTGMWQVSGRSNIEDFEEVVRLDCYYIDNWSLQLDAKILLKTVVVVLKKVGSK